MLFRSGQWTNCIYARVAGKNKCARVATKRGDGIFTPPGPDGHTAMGAAQLSGAQLAGARPAGARSQVAPDPGSRERGARCDWAAEEEVRLLLVEWQVARVAGPWLWSDWGGMIVCWFGSSWVMGTPGG